MDLDSLHGIFPPNLTPLNEDGSVDHESLDRLINYLLDAGVHGIWALGTTGEFACLDADEREAALRTIIKAVRGRTPVIACIADASTTLAIEHGRRAVRAGADYLAVTPPYYYSNGQAELERHFRRVAASVDRPLLLYHIPQTVKVKVDPPVVRRLAQDGVIVGLKDSQNDLEWFRRVVVNAKADGVNLRCFLGTLSLIDLGVYLGGCGAIPGTSNLAPETAVATYEAARAGNPAEALRHQERFMQTAGVQSLMAGAAPTESALASMKAALVKRGVIRTATCRVTAQLPTAEEMARAADIVAAIEGVAV
jgi:4-hydroxy-tetrahydrodipicolinate synthase